MAERMIANTKRAALRYTALFRWCSQRKQALYNSERKQVRPKNHDKIMIHVWSRLCTQRFSILFGASAIGNALGQGFTKHLARTALMYQIWCANPWKRAVQTRRFSIPRVQNQTKSLTRASKRTPPGTLRPSKNWSRQKSRLLAHFHRCCQWKNAKNAQKTIREASREYVLPFPTLWPCV